MVNFETGLDVLFTEDDFRIVRMSWNRDLHLRIQHRCPLGLKFKNTKQGRWLIFRFYNRNDNLKRVTSQDFNQCDVCLQSPSEGFLSTYLFLIS